MDKLFAFDIDGTILDTYAPMAEKVGEKIGHNWSDKPMPYDPDKHGYAITHAEMMDIFYDIIVKNQVQPMEYSLEVLKEYYSFTKRLVFITHRNIPEVVAITKEWIRKHIALPYELYACYKCEKASVAEGIGVTGIIDDHPDVCKGFVEKGMDAICVAAPWHYYQPEIASMNIPVVSSWTEIRNIILP